MVAQPLACRRKVVPDTFLIESESLGILVRSEFRLISFQVVSVREPDSKFAEQVLGSPCRRSALQASPVEPVVEPCSSVETELPVPEHFDYPAAAAAGTGMAERLAVEASVAAPALADKPVGTEAARQAGEQRPEVAGKPGPIPDTAVAHVVEKRSTVAAAAGTAEPDTEQPADSGSRMELAGDGTADQVVARFAVGLLSTASESAERNSFRSSMTNSHR
tara:strand:- start:25148 stop:25807 length:660 start_codon:yes stop_codon:yes gene_type:complete